MKKIFMIQAVLILSFVLFRPVAAEASVPETQSEIWVKEEETIFCEIPKQVSEVNTLNAAGTLSANDANYSEYSFTKNTSYYYTDPNGKEIKVFTLKTEGVVYFYESGLVHIFRCSTGIEEVAKDFECEIVSQKVVNTDGSYSASEIGFYTYSEKYPHGGYRLTVYFKSGSTQTYSDLECLFEYGRK